MTSFDKRYPKIIMSILQLTHWIFVWGCSVSTSAPDNRNNRRIIQEEHILIGTFPSWKHRICRYRFTNIHSACFYLYIILNWIFKSFMESSSSPQKINMGNRRLDWGQLFLFFHLQWEKYHLLWCTHGRCPPFRDMWVP